MTIVGTPLGPLRLSVPSSGIPALRLLLWHAPEQKVELADEKGGVHLLSLRQIDLTHDGIAKLNAGRSSHVPEPTGTHPVAPAAKR